MIASYDVDWVGLVGGILISLVVGWVMLRALPGPRKGRKR